MRISTTLLIGLLVGMIAACTGAPTPIVLSAEEATASAAAPTVVLAPVEVTGQAARAGGWLRLGVRAFNGLDPLAAINSGTEQVQAMIYEPLLAYDEAGNLMPLLAELSVAGEDGLTWTLAVRGGLTFQDGAPLDGTAIAVALAGVLLREPGDAPWSLAVHEFRRVVESVTGDAGTVTVRLRQPYPALPHLLAEQSLAVARDDGVGSGPFVPGEVDLAGGALTLLANPAYHGGAPSLAGVEVRVFAEAAALIEALNNDEIDLAADDELPPFATSDAYQVIPGPPQHVWLIFNPGTPPLEQAGMRLGLNLALDRAALVEVLGLTGFATPDGTFGYDPVRARELFANGGLPDAFDLNLWYTAPRAAAEAVHDQLEAVHVGVALNEVAEVELLWSLAGDDAFLAGELDSRLARRLPVGALLAAWTRDWAGARWVALAGWGPEAVAAPETDSPGAPLYTVPVVIAQRPGLDGLGVTSGGWPRITAQTRLP